MGRTALKFFRDGFQRVKNPECQSLSTPEFRSRKSHKQATIHRSTMLPSEKGEPSPTHNPAQNA